MDSLDCYFYLDMNIPEENRFMQTFCVDCMRESTIQEALFWQGSMRGYGEYKIVCNKCKKLIHEPEE